MSTAPRRVLVPALLAGLTASLLALQFHVFPVLKIAAAERALPPTPGSLLSVLRDPLRADLLLPTAAALAFTLALVAAEVPGRRVSGALLAWTGSWRGALLVAIAMAAVLTRFLIEPGIPHQFDARLHVMESAEVAGALAGGDWPDYCFTYYGGFPLLRFSDVLLYLLVGGLSLLTGSVAVSMKLVVWLSALGSAWAVFALVRELGGGPRGALLAAVGATISFQHTHGVALAGRLPVALLYLLFPLLLLEAERLARRPGLGVAARFGGLAALLVLAHPGLAPYAVLGAVLWIGLRLIARRVPARAWGRAFAAMGVAGLLCILVTAFLVIPALVERGEVQLSRMYATTGLDVSPVPDLGQISGLFVWSNAKGNESVAYIGLSLVALFLFVLFRKRVPGEIRFALGGLALVLLFLSGGSYLSARSAHFLVIVVAAGAGLAASRIGGGRYALLLLIVLVDLGPTTVQSPWRPDLAYDIAFLERVAERGGGERAIRVSVRDGVFTASEWSSNYASGQPLVNGPFREAAGASYPLLLETIESLSADLNRGGDLSPETRAGLRVLGVELLLFEDGREAVLPDAVPAGLRAVPEIPALRFVGGSPVVGLLGADGPPPASGPAGLSAALAALPFIEPDVRLVDRAYGRRRIGLTVEVARDGRLLLSFARLPGVTAAVDGSPADAGPGPFGLLAVPVTAGRHEIELSYEAPRYAVIARVLSAIGGLLLLCLLVLPRIRGRGRV